MTDEPGLNDALRHALAEQVATAAGVAQLTDPEAFTEALDRHGLAVVRRDTLTRMEATTRRAADALGGPRPEPIDTWAVVHLLGHEEHAGRLVDSRQIPGFVALATPWGDGSKNRLINPHKAIFKIEVVTEEEARAHAEEERQRAEAAARPVFDIDSDPWESGRGEDDDQPEGRAPF